MSSASNPHWGRARLALGVFLFFAFPVYFSGILQEERGIRRVMAARMSEHLVSQVESMRTSAQNAHGFDLCRFGDFCISQDNLVLFTPDEDTALMMNRRMAACCTSYSQFHPAVCDEPFPELTCRCFTSRLPPVFRAIPSNPPPFEPGTAFMINQWAATGVKNYHNSLHFAMKFFVFLSVMHHRVEYRIKEMKTLIWQDGYPYDEFESEVYTVGQKLLPSPIKKVLFKPDLIGDDGHGETCFSSAYSSVPYQFWGGTRAVYDRFRTTVEHDFELVKPAVDGCPPLRAAIFRDMGNDKRRMVNDDEMAKLLKKWGYKVDFITSTRTGNTTALDQAREFSQYGLILSSHGTQLINLLYLPRNAAVVQISPVVVDHVYSDLSALLSLHHSFSSGHPSANPSEHVANLIERCTVYNVAGRKCEALTDSEMAYLQTLDLKVDLLALDLQMRAIKRQRIVDCDGLV